MEILLLGFMTGLSLILAIGAQNIFVIEQGLKKNNIFIICLLCSLFDALLIGLGIFIFHYFLFLSSPIVILILNICLVIFLLHFIYQKISKSFGEYKHNNNEFSRDSIKQSILKTIGFTFLNPHVYSDTVFFLGNFSKSMEIQSKITFGLGASFASLIFFFILGYGAKTVSPYLNNTLAWKIINLFIISFMFLIVCFVSFTEIYPLIL
jgi:L-lysine exporter family protein LysE/ArgO|tara:strand:+ start:218 stop:841 length:624 start_codon:yes stop_codon:yes gene_type:complete